MKVLVYLFGSLGDSIVAIPALRAVRRHFPRAEIVMLHDFASGNLVVAAEVVPASLVDRHISYDTGTRGVRKVLGFYDLARRLRAERFDAVIYAVMSERPRQSVARDKYFFRACGIKRAYGFHTISPERLWPVDPDGHPGVSDHEASFRLDRLALDGIGARPDVDFQTPLLEFNDDVMHRVDSWIREKRRKPAFPLFTFGPGCKSQSNLWPFENFLKLGERVLASYDCEVMIVGGPGEFEMGERLIDAWGTGTNAAGLFSVTESASLLFRSDFHIGLDTGTTHLAAAAGTRCFVIFGERSNPGAWYPLGQGHTIVYHRVPCAGCKTQSCPLPAHPCMRGITIDAVWKNLVGALDDRNGSGVKVITV